MKVNSLTAISPCLSEEAAARTARQMRQCAELADLGMQIARAVAARALADWAAPEEPVPTAEPPENHAAEPPENHAPEPSEHHAAEPPGHHAAEPPGHHAPEPPGHHPELAPTPAPEPRANPARAAQRPRAAGLYLRAPTCKSVDPALLFTRVAATVRDCVALEARLAAGIPPAPHTPHTDPTLDPRRAPLGEIFRLVTEDHPNGPERLRAATARLDAALAADPSRTLQLPEIVFPICDELGIEIDYAILPDQYLDLLIEPETDDTPDPRATSPP